MRGEGLSTTVFDTKHTKAFEIKKSFPDQRKFPNLKIIRIKMNPILEAPESGADGLASSLPGIDSTKLFIGRKHF
jgi:hypothetical protein